MKKIFTHCQVSAILNTEGKPMVIIERKKNNMTGVVGMHHNPKNALKSAIKNLRGLADKIEEELKDE